MCNVRKDLETMIYAYRRVHPLPNQSTASVAEIGQGRSVAILSRLPHVVLHIYEALLEKHRLFQEKFSEERHI